MAPHLRLNLLLLLIFLFCSISPHSMADEYSEEAEPERHGGGKGEMFLLRKPKQMVKTEAGEVTVFRGFRRRETSTPMHVGFISMEPAALFLPQYIDASLVFFVRRGEMRIGWIYKDDLVEKQLKIGDIYRIPAGSAFYIVNTGSGQRLQIICSIDTTESLGGDIFQSFFVAGGTYPTPVLAGFDLRTLTTAFNVTEDELGVIMGRQRGGPIVYMTSPEQPRRLAALMKMKERGAREEEDEEEKEQGSGTWRWRKVLKALVGKEKKQGKRTPVRAPDSYNLYERGADFKNNYGWSVALDEHDYAALGPSGVGVYLVNLTAGSMMAPHVNPTATEYGVVLRGSGTVQVVFPNGTCAMNAEVSEGDVFWVPRYFPFCQIASRSGPMEFFGFTTSARRNRPQFLVGQSSILKTMGGPEMATAFGISEERYNDLAGAQRESIILPSWPETPERGARAVA